MFFSALGLEGIPPFSRAGFWDHALWMETVPKGITFWPPAGRFGGVSRGLDHAANSWIRPRLVIGCGREIFCHRFHGAIFNPSFLFVESYDPASFETAMLPSPDQRVLSLKGEKPCSNRRSLGIALICPSVVPRQFFIGA